MIPTDRDLVDGIMRLILSASVFIDTLFEEEIDIMLADGNVSMRRLKALTEARRRCADTIAAMQYALSL